MSREKACIIITNENCLNDLTGEKVEEIISSETMGFLCNWIRNILKARKNIQLRFDQMRYLIKYVL